jgi:hypothetical protein
MSLRQIAEADLGAILEDNSTGFGWSIILTAPDGTVRPLTGFSDDIAQVIDPDTGQAVSGRLASVALRISTIYTEFPGLGLPKSIADSGSKPWIVQFNDINGLSYKFKIAQSNPDRALGMLVCLLEFYR